MSNSKGGTLVDVLVGVIVATAVGVGVYVTATMDKTASKSGAQLGRQYEARAKQLEAIDPKLFAYDEDSAAKITTGLERAKALAIGPEDRIYIAGDREIAIYGVDGDKQRAISTDMPPLCLTIDRDGSVYAGFKDHVRVFGPDGAEQARWDALGADARFSSIGLTPERVFVSDVGMRVVHVYDRAGQKVAQIGEQPKGLEGAHFNIPSPYFDLLVDNTGQLAVVNPGVHKIETWDPAGDFTTPEARVGRYGQDVRGYCGCCNPVNIAVRPDGNIVTSEKGLTRIKVVDRKGNLVSVVAGPDSFDGLDRVCATKEADGGCQEGGLDIAVDSKGRVRVLDPYSGEVRTWIPRAAK